MQKTLRRAACLLFMLTLAAAIVVPTVAEPVGQIVADGNTAAASEEDEALLAKDYALSNGTAATGEPKGEDLVSVIVQVDAPSLIDYANDKGISVQEALHRSEGVRILKRSQSLSESARKALSPYIVEEGYTYGTVLSGFSATIRYRDLSKFEADARVSAVVLSDTYESPQAITENDVNVDVNTGIFDSSVVDYDGTGTVVAVLDTGTDYTHEVFDMELDDTTTAVTKDDVAAVAHALAATSMSAAQGDTVDEDDLYLTTKLPYAYDYADSDANVYPSEAHGTHVAGIIAGKSERITGVATGAQIATFKVFSDGGGGAESEGILAALNDAVLLGVDAINMSLGASCGFTREEDDDAINAVYDSVERAGICLVVAASNDYSSAYGSANGNTNLASNPDSGTVGSPASYSASLAVASISGVKTPYFLLEDGTEIYFRESRLVGKADENDFVGNLLNAIGGPTLNEATLEFVVVPGVGYEANYTGIDVRGKIAVVRRGSNTFEQKVQIAHAMGAVGVIVYNNISGMLNMSVGTKEAAPSCLISMDYGELLVARGTGTIRISRDYLAGPFMSDFSSWGVLPNLTLSPDITAHGGEITSAYPGGNEYDTISGTSMACPNLAGALILVRQYVKDMDASLTTAEVRDLSYSLLMSTATIANNEYGNPYSPRKQGAGLADIAKSVTTQAYLTVEGSNKPKLSLGDDPNRTGVYTLEFNITNLSGKALSYDLDPVVFTESMSSDERTVAELAYLLDAEYSYSAVALENQGSASISGNNITLGGYSTAKITVTVTLTQQSKDYLEQHFVNGMYVEGYVRLRSLNADGIGLNIPYLAFYGDWADAPMLDVTAYEVGASQEDSSVLEEDKLVADVYATLPMAGFAATDENGEETVGNWGMGAFGFNIAQGYATPVTAERYASLTADENGNYMLYSIAAGLLRGAKRVEMRIADSTTGEVIWTKTGYNGRKSSSSGGEQTGGYIDVEFDVREMGLANNAVYTFSMECYLDWGEGDAYATYGNRNTFSFNFTIDHEKPVVLDTYVQDEDGRKTVEFNVYDNHYLQGYVVYTYEDIDLKGNPTGLTAVTDGVVPVYDGEFNSTTRIELDVTSHWTKIMENGGRLYVQFMDYAKNTVTDFVTLERADDLRLEKTRDAYESYTIDINGQLDLSKYVRTYANIGGTYAEDYWTTDLVWESSDESKVTVGNGEYSGGLVTGIATGEATVTVRPANGTAEDALTFLIKVSEKETEIRLSGIKLSDGALELERQESAQLTFTVQPYNLPEEQRKALNFRWETSSPNVVSVVADENDPTRATVTALKSGSATIYVRVDGSYVNAACEVRVKEEFYVDSVYLRSYTGRGDENGIVEIPDDLGISYIYPMAFFDNDYIKGIIIPEGVMYVMRAAIYGCDNLEWVQLPSTLEQVQSFGIAWNPKLEKVYGLNHVSVIGSRAFIYDTSLELGFNGTDENGEPNGAYDLSGTTFIRNMAFYGCESITSVDLSKVGVVDESAFAFCSGLTELTVPANTTLETTAFAYCTALERVTIYSKNIGAAAFAYCTSLDAVTFAGDVDTLGAEAFAFCTSLTEVRFLGSVYRIGDLAFYYCLSLTDFTIPAGLEILGAQVFLETDIREITISKDARISQTGIAAFYGMPIERYSVEAGNKYFTAQEGVLYDKAMHTLVAYPTGTTMESAFTVPASVKVIGDNAFAGLNNVSGNYVYPISINLNNVETIGANAFFGVGTLTGTYSSNFTLTGYDHVRVIGERAFEQSYVTKLPVSEHTVSIGDYAFANTPALSGDIVIPDSVTYLGEGAFMRNGHVSLIDENGETVYYTMREATGGNLIGGITSVTFGKGLSQTGMGAFMYCAELVRIGGYGELTSIASSMFEGCARLSSVALPARVTAVGDHAFAGCSALTSVTLPANAAFTALADGVFMDCALLTSVDIPESVTAVGASAFENTALNKVILDDVTEVGARAFYATKLSYLYSGSVTKIGAEAFADCADLTQVNFPAAETVGDGAFARCAALGTVSLPAARLLGAGAFEGCEALSSLNAEAVRVLGARALADTKALTSLSLPSVQQVGAHAFSGSSLTALSLPALADAEEQAFAGAKSLAAITVSNQTYESHDGVLYRATGSHGYLVLVAYPEGKQDAVFDLGSNALRVIRIDAYAFADNVYLEEVTLPVYLRVIGAGAFYGCEKLTRIEFRSATAPTLESYTYPAEDDEQENVYNNFVSALDPLGALGLTVVVPSNGTGYDLYVWKQYLGEVGAEDGISATGTAQPIRTAIDFMDRVRALPAPEAITEADREELTILQRIYNTLVNTQRNFVSGGFDNTNYYTILMNAVAALPAVEDPSDPSAPTEPAQPAAPNVGLIVGLSVGGAVLAAGIAVGTVFLVRKKRRG